MQGNGTYLDLHCELNPSKQSALGQSMGILLLYNSEDFLSTNKVDYLIAALNGNVKLWWNGIDQTTQNIIKLTIKDVFESSIQDEINHMLNFIANEFLLENWPKDPSNEYKLLKLNEKN